MEFLDLSVSDPVPGIVPVTPAEILASFIILRTLGFISSEADQYLDDIFLILVLHDPLVHNG